MIGEERNVITAAKDSWATYWIRMERGSRQGARPCWGNTGKVDELGK